MVETKDIEALNLELDNRLDDLFGESDILLPDAGQEASKQEYPLAELKNTILSIDWEITDEVLDKLIQQIQELLVTYEDDKIVVTFLQILKSLGNYIKIHRGKAPPKAFKIINSVFSSLDKVVLSEDMPEKAKKKLLRTEMKLYKELREQTSRSQKPAAKGKGKAEAAATDKGEKAPAVRLEKSSKNQVEKAKKAESDSEPDEPALSLESEEKKEEPVFTLEIEDKEEEPAFTFESEDKEEEPVFTLESEDKEEEPVFTLESEDKEKEPAFTLEREEEEDEPVFTLESEEKEKEPLLATDETELELELPEKEGVKGPDTGDKAEPEVRTKAERDTRGKAEPVVHAKPGRNTRDKAERDSHPKLEPGGEAATLAEAVDEIKRYIHSEIKALRKEIRLLRKQK